MGKLNFDRPVETRDGRRVRILCTDAPSPAYPVIGIIEGSGCPTTWTKEGVMHIQNPHSQMNLVNRPEKRSLWVNVYDHGCSGDGFHRSKCDADHQAASGRLACLELTYEVPN